MKILLVSPCSEPHMMERFFMSPPLGVIRLAGFLLRHGHEAEHFDPNYFLVTGKGTSLEDKLSERDWEIIGFSCLEETLRVDLINMDLAHRLCPKALIVAGGIEAQFNYQTILDKSPCRIVVAGEGEIPLLSLANGVPMHEIPGIILKNPSTAMSQELFNEATTAIQWEEIGYEDYWDHYVVKYGDKITPINEQEIHTVRVFSRNRCPIGCKFCSSTNQLTWGSGGNVPVLSTTEDNLIEVVERIVAAHPRTKTIYLTDDDFCINKRSVERFCEKVIERDFGDLSFMCFARATDLNIDLLKLLKRANFRRLTIGVESFSQPILDNMNKRCDAGRIHQALEDCASVGIKPHINIILTPPTATLDDIEISIDHTLQYLRNDYVYAGIIGSIRPLRGTGYREEYCDFHSHILDVTGTGQTLTIDEMIWAEDPYTRRVQEQYWHNAAEDAALQVKAAGIIHATGDNIAEFNLFYMKSLINEVRKQHRLPPFLSPVKDPEFSAWLKDRLEVCNIRRTKFSDVA